jgi:hypothetical protein
MFSITGLHTHGSSYFQIPISYLSGASSFTNGLDIIVTFARTGDRGDTGYQGAQGNQGPTGAQGAQGNQGPQGIQGTTGTQGVIGSSGALTGRWTYKQDNNPLASGQFAASPGNQTPMPLASMTSFGIYAIDNNGISWTAILKALVNAPGGLFGTGDDIYIQVVKVSNPSVYGLFKANYVNESPSNSLTLAQINSGWLVAANGNLSVGDECYISFSPIGIDGSQGFQGRQGDQGPRGFQGDQGARGFQGWQGDQGRQGAQGDQGRQGYQGDQGAQGRQGPQGDQGRQGYQGDRGFQGYQGDRGFQGNQGPQGIKGDQGNQGPTGLQGTTGAQGNQGPTGIQGTVGTTGFQGNQGPTGLQGTTGAQGNQGPTGLQGTAGTNGTNGTNGAQGATGPQGNLGPQGNTGAASSVAGPQGNVGAQGAAGPNVYTDTLATVTARGSTTSATLTSTNGLGLYVNSGGASYIGINSTSSWAYTSLLNNGTTTWDLGAFNGGNFEFRPYGGESNRIIVGLNGVMYFTDTTNGIYKSGGRFTVRSESTDNVANFASYGMYLPKTGETAGLYVESPIEARTGLRMGSGAGNGTITVGADTSATANRLVQRDSGGDIYSRYSFAIHFNASCANNENPSIGGIWANSTSDNYLRKSTPAHFISQLGLITTSNYSSYALPLSGGTMTGKILAPSFGTDVYGGAFEIRERGYVLESQSAWSFSPAITFHWGNRWAKRFGGRADGLFAIDDEPIALRSWVTSQGYITGYTETDTLASVTGRGATTSSPITINGGGTQPLALTTSSGSPWHLALVRNDLGLTTRVFAHNSPYNGWYFEHNIIIAGNTNIHSGNYNSYSPTLTGGNASGTWGISITGNAQSSTTTTHLSSRTDGTWYNVIWGAGSPSYLYSADSVQIRSSDGALRANIFYDSQDTAYYVDPNSVSSQKNIIIGLSGSTTSYGAASSGKLYFGTNGSDSPDYYHIATNMENFGGNYTKLDILWYTGQRFYAHNGYGGFRFKEITGGQATLFSIGEGDTNVRVANTLFVNGDVRSPIYYDSNDTAYYLNPAGGSRLRNLYVGDSGDDWSDPGGWGTQIRFSNGPHVKFVLHARTPGIEAGMYVHTPSSVYIGSYTGHDVSMMWGGNRKMQITNSYVYTDVYLEAAGSLRAPIFYDSNNTAYYGDFASTSVMNAIRFGTSTNNGTISGADTWGIRVQTDSGYIWLGPANGGHAHIYTDRANFYFNAQLTVNGGSQINTSDIRASIFYDVDNTGYYLDPNSTSRLYATQFDYIGVGQAINTGYRIIINGDYYANGGGNYWAEGRFKQYRGSGTWHDVIDSGNIGSQSVSNADTVDGLHASSFSRKDTSGQYLRAFYEYGSYLTSETPANLVDQGLAGGGLRVDFMHPSYTGSSGWNHVITWSGYNAYNMYQLGGHYDGGTGTNLWVRSEANHGRTSWTSWRRLLNTASDSYAANMNQEVRTDSSPTFAQVYNNGWFRTVSHQGLYNPTNDAHFYPNNASYGAWRIDGTRNGWHGLHFNSGSTLMMNSTETGIHREGYGWQFRWYAGQLYVSRGTYGGSTEYTVIDSGTIGSQSVSSASTVTGASTMSGYLTVSANWGTSPYTSALTVIGTYPSITLRGSNSDWEYLMHMDSAGDIQYYFGPGYTVNNWSQRYTFGRYGDFYVRTGTITASGDITAYSDIRVKENIEVIENALEKVQAIRGVTFNRTDLEKNKDARHAGVIAQEVIKVLPEVVNINDTGLYSVAYGNLNALLIEAIKEQQQQIEELKQIIANK